MRISDFPRGMNECNIIMRPLCENCGYVFEYEEISVETILPANDICPPRFVLQPHQCPRCGRYLAGLIIPVTFEERLKRESGG